MVCLFLSWDCFTVVHPHWCLVQIRYFAFPLPYFFNEDILALLIRDISPTEKWNKIQYFCGMTRIMSLVKQLVRQQINNHINSGNIVPLQVVGFTYHHNLPASKAWLAFIFGGSLVY